LSKPEYRNLKIELLRKYGGKFGLSQVGWHLTKNLI
jgi:hypothetical protein